MMDVPRCNPYATVMKEQAADKANSSKHNPMDAINKEEEKKAEKAAAAKAKKVNVVQVKSTPKPLDLPPDLQKPVGSLTDKPQKREFGSSEGPWNNVTLAA